MHKTNDAIVQPPFLKSITIVQLRSICQFLINFNLCENAVLKLGKTAGKTNNCLNFFKPSERTQKNYQGLYQASESIH